MAQKENNQRSASGFGSLKYNKQTVDIMTYNARKAAQTIAYFALKNDKEPLDVLKAVKLVFLADRESIKMWGAPIQDEMYVSMPHGPVNSITYAHINGEHNLKKCGWSKFIEDREDHKVALSNNDILVQDLDELSDADLSCLDTVWGQFGHMSKWEIRDWTHERKNIPEWEDPKGSSLPIPLERIMMSLGIDNPDEQAALLKDHRKIDNLFASLSR